MAHAKRETLADLVRDANGVITFESLVTALTFALERVDTRTLTELRDVARAHVFTTNDALRLTQTYTMADAVRRAFVDSIENAHKMAHATDVYAYADAVVRAAEWHAVTEVTCDDTIAVGLTD